MNNININDEMDMSVEFTLERGYSQEDLDILELIEQKRMERN